MLHKHNSLDFSGQSIYAGIDVHNKSWKVCIYCDNVALNPMTMPPEPEKLISYMRKNYPGANYNCAYEAGYSGFWIQKEFTKHGINCLVVNPADVPSTDKEKHFKTDRIDCRKIAKSLSNGELKGVYVPSREELENRNLLRMRYLTVKKLTRVKNEIKGMLSYYGINHGSNTFKRNWSKAHVKFLETITMTNISGNCSYQLLIKEFKFLNELILELTKKIDEMSAQIRYKEDFDNLITAPGIGKLSAMIILTELIDIRRFKSLCYLNSYAGLIPSEHSSGEKQIRYKITRRGNSYLKKTLIECAWSAIRKDPALLMSYKKHCNKMNPNMAIIKIARKLLNRIRYILINKKQYVMNTVF